MSGVDKGDQLRKYYRVRSKSRKNYKYIFWFIFDTSIVNAYILSKYSPSTVIASKENLKHFRLKLAQELIGSYRSRKRAGRPRSSSIPPPPTSVLRLDLQHHPTHGGKSRRCALLQVEAHSFQTQGNCLDLYSLPQSPFSLSHWAVRWVRLFQTVASQSVTCMYVL